MAAEVAGEQPRIDVVAAADLPADDHLDTLAAIERGQIVSLYRVGEGGKYGACARNGADEPVKHLLEHMGLEHMRLGHWATPIKYARR